MPITVRAVAQPTNVLTGTLTSGAATVAFADTTTLAGAVKVSGSGVPAGTLVSTVDSGTQITLTKPATATGSFALTFTMEPVGLAEAKAQLRVTFPDDDVLIARLINAARRYCEVLAKVVFLSTTFDLNADVFPVSSGYLDRNTRQFYGQFTGLSGGGLASWAGLGAPAASAIVLPRAPVVSVTSVTYLDSNGQTQTLSPSLYTVVPGAPGRVAPAYGQVWPVTYPQVGAVTVRFVAGYGTDANSLPDNIKSAVLLYVGNLYENRESVTAGDPVLHTGVLESLLGIEDNAGGYA